MRDLTDKEYWEKLARWEKALRKSISEATGDLPDGSETAVKERVERARIDRFFFFKHYLPYLFEDPFTEHHQRLADDLDNEDSLLAIAFRGWGKSTFIIYAETLWELVAGKTEFAVLTGKTDEQTLPLVLQLRIEFEANGRIRQDFGDQALGPIWQMTHFVLNNGREVMGRTLGGAARGPRSLKNKRPDLWVLSDLQEKKDAKNPDIIDGILDFIRSVVIPAMNPKRAKVRVEGTRVSEDCALSQLHEGDENNEPWPTFELLAIDGDGNPTEPHRYPLHVLAKKKREMGTDPFDLEFQLTAKSKEGTFRREWIKYYRPEQIIDLPLLCGVYEDPATSADSDHKAIISIGYHKETGNYYVLRAFIRQHASPEECAAEFYRQWNDINKPPLRQGIAGFEDNGAQELIVYPMELYRRDNNLSYIPAVGVTNTINKDIRVGGLAPDFENGKFHFIKGHSDQKILVDQFVFYPKKKRDGPDATRGVKDLIQRLLKPGGGIVSRGRRTARRILRGYGHATA
ncbi:MAG: hypothetical protein FVQ81_13250 [Candidatus Glassbacteria bacterium]|nr:hypothetical protein [Candidatus Glassbacteria bacterium]